MNVQVKKLPKSTYEIDVLIPQSEVKKEFDHVTSLFAENVELPGFRKGKAPASLVVERIGAERINKEALQSLLEKKFPLIMKEADLSPITNPSVKVDTFDPEKDLSVKITVAVMPEVEVKDYKKIKVKKEAPSKIEDNQIDQTVKELFENWSKADQTSPKSEEGAILGPGGEVLVPGNKEPDDSFAQKVGAKDLTDLKEKIKLELEQQELYRVDKEHEAKIIDELLKRTKTEVPEPLVAEETNRMLVRMNMQIQQMGGSFEDYLKSQGKTAEQLRAEWSAPAEKNVKTELALTKIAEAENITIPHEEVDRMLSGHDHHSHTDEEKAREEAYYEHVLKQGKALDILKNQS